ncbi:hypothetical protein ACFQ12_27005, partial [Methylobacterium trifolii]
MRSDPSLARPLTAAAALVGLAAMMLDDRATTLGLRVGIVCLAVSVLAAAFDRAKGSKARPPARPRQPAL